MAMAIALVFVSSRRAPVLVERKASDGPWEPARRRGCGISMDLPSDGSPGTARTRAYDPQATSLLS